MTNKENSIKLNELGFEGDSEDFIVLDVPDISKRIMFPKVPTYDAEVLFKWLMEWAKGDLDDLVTYLDCVQKPPFTFKTTLADLLAEAIIWILENES